MKKYFLIVVLCLLSFSLVSCTASYSFMHGEPDIDTIKIEIVNIEIEMGYHAGSDYSEENVSVIKVIENDKMKDFLSDFKKIKCYQPNSGGRIDSILGKAIRITYANGDIELITDYGTATVKNGEILTQTTTFDSEAFEALLKKYS